MRNRNETRNHEGNETMIALIEIPHQRRARINWYDDAAALIHEAEDYGDTKGDANIHRHGFDSPVENAAHELADDWHGKILVRSAADLDDVRNYTGHQHRRVRAMILELEIAFSV